METRYAKDFTVIRLLELRDASVLEIFKQGERAGQLERTSTGTRFRYDQVYLEKGLPSIAFSLPRERREVHMLGDRLVPFFSGLLPGGSRRDALARVCGTARDDEFTLLAALGPECVGDVGVLPVGASVDAYPVPDSSEFSFESLYSASITKSDLTNEPVFPGRATKFAGELLPEPHREEHCLVKFGTGVSEAENEFWCLQLAKKAGLRVVSSKLMRDSQGTVALLVERYDRMIRPGDGGVTKLGQEDACQFLGRSPSDQYRVTLSSIMHAIARHATSPINEGIGLLELLSFNYLVGNGDFHARDITLLKDSAAGTVTLAPAYGLRTTLPLGKDSLALLLGSESKEVRGSQLAAFGEQWGVPYSATVILLNRIVELVLGHMEEGLDWLSQDQRCELLSKITQRSAHLLDVVG
jgi:serine/threonine-protein kinase HipA